MARRPGVHGWFADEVRRLREKMGWSQLELAKRVFLSEQQIGHFETGYRTPSKVEDCIALDRVFELDGHFEGMFALMKDEQVPNDFWRFLKAEGEASSVKAYETQVITGLMQIEAYTRTLCRAAYAKRTVDERVATSMERQKILQRTDPPWLWVVMDYPALCRNVGGPEVMRAQYEHLLALADHPRIRIQVIPEKTGVHAGLEGPFQILTLPDGADVAWSDSARSARFFDQPDEVAQIDLDYDLIRTSALSVEATRDLIKSLLERLDNVAEE